VPALGADHRTHHPGILGQLLTLISLSQHAGVFLRSWLFGEVTLSMQRPAGRTWHEHYARKSIGKP